MRRKALAAAAVLLLAPAVSHAQAWSGAEQATVDLLNWICWSQWTQNGLMAAMIASSVIFSRGGR